MFSCGVAQVSNTKVMPAGRKTKGQKAHTRRPNAVQQKGMYVCSRSTSKMHVCMQQAQGKSVHRKEGEGEKDEEGLRAEIRGMLRAHCSSELESSEREGE